MKHSNKERFATLRIVCKENRRINTLSEAESAKLVKASACDITKAVPISPPSSQFPCNFSRRQSMEQTACPIIALASTLELQPNATNGIPILVEACLRYLSTNAIDCEGLFRVPGNSKRVSQLWQYMDKHPFARLSMSCVNVFMRNHPEFTPHDVASFMKRAIKSMVGDEHVVTYDCYEPLVSLVRSKCPTDEIGTKCRRIIGQLLVPARRLLLGRLCNFLREFSEHHETTHMNCSNLAVCFAHLMQPSSVGALKHPQASKKDPRKWHLHRPSWLRNNKVKKPMSAERLRELMVNEGQKSKLCVSVIKVLIEESESIFRNRLSLTPPRQLVHRRNFVK